MNTASRLAFKLLRQMAGSLLAFACLCAPPWANAQAQAETLHGADSVFVVPDVAVVWAVLKQPGTDRASVWMRIVNRAAKFSHVSVDGVDPFSKKRERVTKGTALDAETRIEADRESFADLTSRELHFYRSEADWKADRAALTVYYLGVPDTTPEFSSRSAMDEYLRTVRLVAGKPEQKP